MNSVTLPGADAPVFIHDATRDEPTLDEILADPIVGLILRRDGLTAGAVRVKLDRERRRLARVGAPVLPRAA